MTPSKLRLEVVTERAVWIRRMIAELRSLPLESLAAFEDDARTPAAAESCLRRALEALLDLGRHMLSKGFGRAAQEYKQIADLLVEVEVLSVEEGRLLREMAGYRNRLVHFYDLVSNRELHQIATGRLEEIEGILQSILTWVHDHPERVEG